MNQLKRLAGETAIYGVSSILGRMLNYLLVPIYTAYFEPGQYGIVTEIYAYTAFMVIIFTYGLETAYFRFATSHKKEENLVYNSAETSILTSSILLSLILILFATPIVNYLEYPGRERYVYWFAAILSIDAIVAIPFAKLRLEHKAKQFAIAKLINIFLNIILNIFFIVVLKMIYEGDFLPSLTDEVKGWYDPDLGPDYVFLSNLIANASLLLVLSKIIFKARLNIKWKYLKPMLIYAYPLLFMGLAGATNEMLSRALLKKLLPDGFYEGMDNIDALGVFGACYKLSVFMTLTIQAFRYAAEPFFFSRAEDKNSPELFRDVMHWFVIMGAFIFLIVSLNLDIVASIFLQSPEYWRALPVVPVLLLANLFLGIYYNLSVWFKLTDKTFFGTWISGTGAIITIVLNFILIPYFGYEGSAVVTLITYFTMSAMSYFIGRKYYPIPYRVMKDLFYIIFATIVYYVVSSLPEFNLVLDKVLDILVIIFFAIFVYWIERKEIKKNLVKK